MKKLLYTTTFLLSSAIAMGQNYTSYFTGNETDVVRNPTGGVCMMGGATENDEAMKWFLQQADGGDILVLRASGSDGYNDYMYSDLGVNVNSVETIVFNEASAASETYIQEKIAQAEGIWFAGGDQWNYISYWRANSIANLINEAVADRNIVIGGTSAGMAILGDVYYSAENGTVSSGEALSNPYHPNVTADKEAFLEIPFLTDVITDTHYDNPDRKGRHVTFLSRMYTDDGINSKGIACDEYTAVCIDNAGMATIYGDAPEEDDNAYFIQINCENEQAGPELCEANMPLNWNRENAALKVYQVKGTNDGLMTFDLNDWKTGTGGEWKHWYVENGNLMETTTASAPDCEGLSLTENDINKAFSLYPNPVVDNLQLHFTKNSQKKISIYSTDGRQLLHKISADLALIIDLQTFVIGTYIVEVEFKNSIQRRLIIKQ